MDTVQGVSQVQSNHEKGTGRPSLCPLSFPTVLFTVCSLVFTLPFSPSFPFPSLITYLYLLSLRFCTCSCFLVHPLHISQLSSALFSLLTHHSFPLVSIHLSQRFIFSPIVFLPLFFSLVLLHRFYLLTYLLPLFYFVLQQGLLSQFFPCSVPLLYFIHIIYFSQYLSLSLSLSFLCLFLCFAIIVTMSCTVFCFNCRDFLFYPFSLINFFFHQTISFCAFYSLSVH